MEGGGQCSGRNYSMIQRVLGAENVDSYYIHNDDQHRSIKSYIEGILYMPMGYFFGLTPKRCREIVAKAQNYDYVFIDRSVFGIIARQLKSNGYSGKIITHFHNIERIYFDAKLSRHLTFRSILLHNADSNDRWACMYSDQVIVLNRRDGDTLEKEYGRQQKAIIPITLHDTSIAPKDSNVLTAIRPRCLFLGSYFAANNEGILWFVRQVLPHVDVEIKIVGKGMKRLKAEAKELADIEVVSDAPDLRPFWEWADVMVLPIFSGSGMKVKTCESLMNGKNIIGTTEAFEGYELQYDRVGGKCDTAEEFITCIHQLSKSPRSQWNEYSRQVYLEKYSNQAVQLQYEQLLNN